MALEPRHGWTLGTLVLAATLACDAPRTVSPTRTSKNAAGPPVQVTVLLEGVNDEAASRLQEVLYDAGCEEPELLPRGTVRSAKKSRRGRKKVEPVDYREIRCKTYNVAAVDAAMLGQRDPTLRTAERSVVLRFAVSDDNSPEIRVQEPRDGVTTAAESVRVRVHVPNPDVARVVIMGRDASTGDTPGDYSIDLSLQPGENIIPIQAFDDSGNMGATEVTVIHDAAYVEPPPPAPKVQGPRRFPIGGRK